MTALLFKNWGFPHKVFKGVQTFESKKKKRNAVNSTFLSLLSTAADRNRTGTGITTHGILSPGRLPVPPLRHVILFKKQKMGPTGLEPVTLCL